VSVVAAALLAAGSAGAQGAGASGPAPPRAVFEPYELRLLDGRTVAAELGRLRVPERRGRAGGRELGLAFVRLRSTSARPGAPIVFLAGGPGDSGIEIARIPE
jgi:hypothetical protein